VALNESLFLLFQPELVERLIVVDISPISVPRSTGEMTAIFDAMVSLDLSPTLPMSEGRKLAKKTLLQATEDQTVDFIMLNLRKDPKSGVYVWHKRLLVNGLK